MRQKRNSWDKAPHQMKQYGVKMAQDAWRVEIIDRVRTTEEKKQSQYKTKQEELADLVCRSHGGNKLTAVKYIVAIRKIRREKPELFDYVMSVE
jgi:hypothetical protein